MQSVAYTVGVTFVDGQMANAWLDWLAGGHVAEVLAGGAVRADLLALDGDGLEFEVRYQFPSREAFQAYERLHAPRLRAEGLALFPPDRGVSYRRTVGDVLATFVGAHPS
jgi:hypothetical protein